MDTNSARNIGIFGGSFNPIHIAHLKMASRFVEQMNLDVCVFVPAYQSPFKQPQQHTAAPSQTFPSGEQRLQMVMLATASNKLFTVYDNEIKKQEVSYTIDTIEELEQVYPGCRLHLLIGTDQAVVFTKWKDWERIVQKVQLCIVHRSTTYAQGIEQITTTLTYNQQRPVWISAPTLEISSTEIRNRVASGKPIHDMVPEEIARFIQNNSLYQ